VLTDVEPLVHEYSAVFAEPTFPAHYRCLLTRSRASQYQSDYYHEAQAQQYH